MKPTDFVQQIMDYEAGHIPQAAIPQFFCDLANSGTLASLQGSYHRAWADMRRNYQIGRGRIDGRPTWVPAPSFEELKEWDDEGGCEAVACGCWVEPDGQCACGNLSWLRYFGMI